MDLSYLLSLQAWRESMGGALDGVFLLISELGMPTIPLLVSLVCYWSVCKRTGLYLMFACNVSDWLNGVLKLWCSVYRPWVRDARLIPVKGALSGASGYSFPSGHSSKAAAFYGGLAWQLRRRKAWMILCLLAVPLVMFSRNYLGVHTPQDVLVGMAVGGLTLALVGYGSRLLEKKPEADVPLALGVIALCALSIVFVSLKAYPMDYAADGSLLVDPEKMKPDTYLSAGAVIGMMAGWLLERRAVHFSTEGVSLCKRLLRSATGIAVVLALYLGVGKAFQVWLGANWGGLLRTTLMCFYAAGLHPLLFTRAEAMADRRGNPSVSAEG